MDSKQKQKYRNSKQTNKQTKSSHVKERERAAHHIAARLNSFSFPAKHVHRNTEHHRWYVIAAKNKRCKERPLLAESNDAIFSIKETMKIPFFPPGPHTFIRLDTTKTTTKLEVLLRRQLAHRVRRVAVMAAARR